MNLITRDTDYAMRALCVMARSREKIISVDELVRETKIPRPFLRKILQVLNKKSIAKSYRGKGGGFSLIKNPSNICLADIMRVFQGEFKLSEHMFKKKKCPRVKKCNLKKKLDEIDGYVQEQLASITVASIK
ncbi:MAG: Rrf2 family transcriptional regulator [Candidatus Saelkia tenebricola]|nr:Rrf2 family transcriptional regulator [Candidatus Saelkia tenebricola]